VVEVADVFRRFAEDYLKAHGATMPSLHRRAIADILACRTEVLAGCPNRAGSHTRPPPQRATSMHLIVIQVVTSIILRLRSDVECVSAKQIDRRNEQQQERCPSSLRCP